MKTSTARRTSDRDDSSPASFSRRAFLHGGALVLVAGFVEPRAIRGAVAIADIEKKPALRLGLLTDLHYADKEKSGSRIYRESSAKAREAVDLFNERKATVAVELGDFIDAAESVEEETRYLEAIEQEFARFKGERHYVLGNHCVATLSKKEFFQNTAATRGHYSFDAEGFHFVILDACYRPDGVEYEPGNFKWNESEIPPKERAWLKKDLSETDKPTVVFVHQRLDVGGNYGVKSATDVREILAGSKKVLAVFQGHNHVNDHKEIGGIHYVTLQAVVEGTGAKNSAYAVLDLFESGVLKVEGFRRQKGYEFPE